MNVVEDQKPVLVQQNLDSETEVGCEEVDEEMRKKLGGEGG